MLTPAPSSAVLWVAGVALGTLLLLVIADLFLTWTGRLPVGAWVTRWARRYPIFALGLTLLAGALLGHFFFALG